MKIKEMLEEAARLDADIGNDIYEELFMSMSEEVVAFQSAGVLVLGHYDGAHTFQEDGKYYVAMVEHDWHYVSELQECSKLLYDELMKLKHYV
jgi:hypothetical protein